jgi:hypothetical protein
MPPDPLRPTLDERRGSDYSPRPPTAVGDRWILCRHFPRTRVGGFLTRR